MKHKTKKGAGELIYGIHPIVELLKAKRRKLITLYTTKPTPKAWSEIEKHMPQYPVPIQYVSRAILTRMADSPDHQGVVAWVQPFPFCKTFFVPAKHSFLVMLDGIQDARNLGAILRSAYCTGATGAILLKKGSSPLNAAAIKASAGLAEHMDIVVAPSIQAALVLLKQAKYNVYVAAFKGKSALLCHFTTPLCLVVGSEGFGASKESMREGETITLPQKTHDISYNASVAAGILLFLVAAQQQTF